MLFVENIALPLAEVVIPVGIILFTWFSKKSEARSLPRLFGMLAAGLMFAFVVGGIRFVSTGKYGVETTFGEVLFDRPAHDPGLTWVYPWVQIQEMSSRKETVHATEGNKNLQVVAKDGLLLTVDADLSMLVNKKYAARVYSAYGSIESLVQTLMNPSLHTAIKNAGLGFEGKEAWETKRLEFQTRIHDNFVETVLGQIAMLPEFRGFSPEELKEVFTFPPALLGPTLPPAVVTDQVAQFRAADEAKNTEGSLTAVAKARQVTSEEDAKVVAAYIKALPPNVTLADVSMFLQAQAFQAMVADKRPIGPVTIIIGGGDQRSSTGPAAPVAPAVPKKN